MAFDVFLYFPIQPARSQVLSKCSGHDELWGKDAQ